MKLCGSTSLREYEFYLDKLSRSRFRSETSTKKRDMLLTTIMLMFEIGKFREDFVTYRRTLPDDSTMKLGRVQVTFVLAKYSEKDSLNDSIVNLCNTHPQTKKILNDSVQYVKGNMILSIPSILNSLL